MTYPAISDLATLSDEDLQALASKVLRIQSRDVQENQLHYYKPVSDTAYKIHTTAAKTIGIGGGNGAGKTDHALAEMVIRATGHVPQVLKDTYPMHKLRGPIACRVVVESLTTTLTPIILPKLQYWKWSGIGRPGSDQGHWGWIPKECLIGGEWKESWTEKLRTLRLLYHNPDTGRLEGESSIQFMSYDQDPSDFASGDFHFILHDEPPTWAIWRENRARVMRVDGTLALSMTWPDDPTIAVDWIFDEIYEKAQPGPARDPGVEWINIFTTDNPHLNQAAVSHRASQMSDTERQVRIYGQPIRFSSRVHPLFTDATRCWCFTCGIDVIEAFGQCSKCLGTHITHYNHVQHLTSTREWPVVYVLDPHPRKPHMMSWTQITPNDDLEQICELSVEGGCEDVRDAVAEVEKEHGWGTIMRLIDPNMGRSPSSAKRGVTWQEEFDHVGLACDLADDADVGRARFNDYLKPDRDTSRPRWHLDSRCVQTSFQIRRYVWDDFRMSAGKSQKQVPKDSNDDYPTCIKYLMNSNPTFRGLKQMGTVLRRPGQRGAMGY